MHINMNKVPYILIEVPNGTDFDSEDVSLSVKLAMDLIDRSMRINDIVFFSHINHAKNTKTTDKLQKQAFYNSKVHMHFKSVRGPFTGSIHFLGDVMPVRAVKFIEEKFGYGNKPVFSKISHVIAAGWLN